MQGSDSKLFYFFPLSSVSLIYLTTKTFWRWVGNTVMDQINIEKGRNVPTLNSALGLTG